MLGEGKSGEKFVRRPCQQETRHVVAASEFIAIQKIAKLRAIAGYEKPLIVRGPNKKKKRLKLQLDLLLQGTIAW